VNGTAEPAMTDIDLNETKSGQGPDAAVAGKSPVDEADKEIKVSSTDSLFTFFSNEFYLIFSFDIIDNTALGANPTIGSYNASVVKIYSAVNSMARFQIKNYFSPIYKLSSLLQSWRCSCKLKNCRIGSRY
jgi:hypothetical protein